MNIRPDLNCKTERYRKLSRLGAYYAGTQYVGRPDFWTGGDEAVPLRERAPCVVYPLPKAATNQATRFLFGEGRYPSIAADPVDEGDLFTLSEDEADRITQCLTALEKQARLRSVMRQLARRGLSTGTAAASIELRKGRFCVTCYHAKDCIPVFADCESTELESLTICYEFDKLTQTPDGVSYVRSWFRRDITAEDFIVYEDEPVKSGEEPRWRVNTAETVHHGLGFCPAAWIKNLADDGEQDGQSLYEGLEDEFDALNLALSQRHRGLVYFGTPQAYETGVDDGERPGAPARTARPLRAREGAGEGIEGSAFGVTKKARKKAPDEIWSYRAPDVKLGLLETSGKSFEVATMHVLDVRARILEAIDVVLLDPSTVAGKGDISAKALSYLYAPLLALVDELRECWWTFGIERIQGLMLRMIAKLGGRGVLISGATEVASILQRFSVNIGGEAVWVAPPLTPTWGDYFSPSNGEIKEATETAAKASGVLVSKKTATKYVAPYFGVSDPDAEAEELEAEAGEAMAAEHEAQAELVKAAGDEPDEPAKESLGAVVQPE